MAQCKNHTQKEAEFRCVNCNNHFCPDCVDKRQFETFTAYVCKTCGGKCESADLSKKDTTVVKKTDVAESFSFWGHLLTIFTYPFKDRGTLITLAGTIAFTFIISILAIPLGKFTLVIFGFYALVCAIKIVEASAFSEFEEPPSWPEIIHIVDWFGIAFRFILATVICFCPALFYFLRFPQADAIFFILLFLGMYIYPMCILAISITEKLSVLNPFILTPSIVKTFLPYTAAFILWTIFLSVHYIIGLTPFMDIPILGPLLKWFFFVYFLFVNMRLLGIFYRGYKDKLQWFDEDIASDKKQEDSA